MSGNLPIKSILKKRLELNTKKPSFCQHAAALFDHIAEIFTNGRIRYHDSLTKQRTDFCTANIENITDSDIEEIQAWANAQYERVSEIADIGTLPDVMSFGETIVIKGVDGSKASLSIGDNQISPDEGSEEVIDICFSNGDENTTSGYIKLTVGYLNFDEDGGATDGLSDDVEYEYDDILKELDSFIDAQKREVKKDTKIAEIISDVINAGIDNT